MKWNDLIAMSLSNLLKRKLRTILTILGVMIGTAAIVVMLSLGIGLKNITQGSIDKSQELTTITITPKGGGYHPKMSQNLKKRQKALALNDEAIAKIKAIPNVAFVSPVLEMSALLQQSGYEANIQIYGYSEAALKSFNFDFASGSMPEFKANRLPLIFGGQVGQNFFSNKPSSGEQDYSKSNVDFKKNFFAIFDVGAYYEAKGGGGKGQEASTSKSPPKKEILKPAAVLKSYPNRFSVHDNNIYTEVGALKSLMSKVYKGKPWPGQATTSSGKPIGKPNYNQLLVKTTGLKHTKEVQARLKEMGFQTSSQISFIEQMEKQSKTIQAIFGGIGAISLLVAAIGIANTMMMSVYERTKEIGVIKVLGCSLSNIRNMFLMEAAFIGFFGGIVGLAFSFTASAIINVFSGSILSSIAGGEIGGMGGMGGGTAGQAISSIPIWLSLFGLVFSSLIGIVSGIMPALRAMRLSALEAIRSQ